MTTSARRQLFRRSKAGCWNCRSKKKKCDELRPHCSRCIRAGESCRYPDASSESLNDSSSSVAGNDHASPGMSSSASFPNSLPMHITPMMSRSSSNSGYGSSHVSHHGQHHPYHHHHYASSPDGLQHRDYHPHRSHSAQRLSPPASSASHHAFYPGPHTSSQAQLAQQQFPPPTMSASAAEDWGHTSQQHVYKRARYDEFSSSSSCASSNPALADARARQPYHAHHRIPSNQSTTSSKGKNRETLVPISPHQAHSVPMAASASLPRFNTVSPPPPPPPPPPQQQQRPMVSPSMASGPVDTSPSNHQSPVFSSSRKQVETTPESGAAASPTHSSACLSGHPTAHDSASLASHAVTGYDSRPASARSPSPRPSSSSSQPRHKLVFDYVSTEPNPEDLMTDLHSMSICIVTQHTKGAQAYFLLLQAIARMNQGQAMAHALAAMIATQQANLASRKNITNEDGSRTSAQTKAANMSNPALDNDPTQLLELANRHHLAAVKALQTQQQPSRRRRFSVIETNNSSSLADKLPAGSNAATMMLLILACSSVGKSLMLPSYFNQCEQFLADAVQHISSKRLFPSVTGEAMIGTPEDPPIESPDNLTNYGGLLFLGMVVGLYECYLSQYIAVTDWDYNPARLRRLLPFNWSDSDAAVFDQVRGCVAETTYSVSMLTLELVIETMDTMRKFKRAEALAYGGKKSSRSEADDGTAALDSLALREELSLLIRDLENGSFWKGSIRILSEVEESLVSESLAGKAPRQGAPIDDNGGAGQNMPPPTLPANDTSNTAITQAFKSGCLFLTSSEGPTQVNRLRLANHLYRNALLVDLYVTVFNRSPNSLVVRELVSRSMTLLGAVPEKSEQGLMWPAIVLGSYAQDEKERGMVRDFVTRNQWKGTTGPANAADILDRVWSDDDPSMNQTWRESVTYFGSPYIS
ncbi:uncharacterized protein MEPE_01551 [Melanopsichium pennsylvanicum]|uniref:Zn(2)-C6 fungal-type domain-containing protein n=2 Tax=Melanopsichium pennsylvanicum TaxID=63383 RepID=A0AAJ5C3Q1_9BASI|nr:ume6 transcription factor [Melanopsichium pennsylvanicum 4]SNX82845.1 uncharacterized protein MEPE_01551 [Melanopsichium pennsylvanicum]